MTGMTKEQIINLRNTLKAGKNFALRMTVTDLFTTIDESNKFQFTKWDDTNGILYSFKLVNNITDVTPNNNGNYISVMAIAYADLTSMEVVALPVNELDTFFASLASSGCNMSNDFKKLIKHTFTSVLHPDRYQLPPTLINELLGENTVNDKDDYYAGRFTESTKETLRYAERNARIEEENNNG